MTRVLVLDSEAFSALARSGTEASRAVRDALEAARRLERDVVTPAVVLAELYRGGGHNQMVDACLSRETGIAVRQTDKGFARLVGSVLATAGAGSEDMVDAHVVASAVEVGEGVVLTGDKGDIERLAGRYPQVTVVALP